MIELAGLTALNLGIAQAALTTLATMLAVGVAFMARPSAATLFWAGAFTLSMVATVGVVAADLNDAETIRRACLGALMGAPALLWSGFRAHWGLRPFGWVALAMAAVSAGTLVVAGDIEVFTVAYRAVFFAASLFAGLFFVEWVRVPARRREKVVLPLAIASAAFLATGLATFASGVFFPPTGGDDLALVRLVSSIGMLLYVGCALVAVMGIATGQSVLVRTPTTATDWQRFERAAVDRLQRAQRTAEPWSVVYLRLDDASDIRQTAGSAALATLSGHLEQAARSIFPADSDIGTPAPGATVILVPRSDAAVRNFLRDMLARVPQLDVDSRLAIRPTASAGWAPASVIGYDLDALVYTAREAAALAADKGGDRWEKVSAQLVERLLIQTEAR